MADSDNGRKPHQVAVFASEEHMLTGLFKRPFARRPQQRRRDEAPPAPPAARPARPTAPANGHAGPAETLEEWQAGTVTSVRNVPHGFKLPPDGVLDLEELAAAMRTVLERERDEIIRKGGPIEKQLAYVKERLGEQTEQTKLWRERARVAAEQRNEYRTQLEAQIKINRQLRNEMNILKKGGRPKVVDLPEILRVVQSTPGFEVKRQGNGHYGIYQEDKVTGNMVFVTDAASSGQGNKVDTATRVKLRKAGVDV